MNVKSNYTFSSIMSISHDLLECYPPSNYLILALKSEDLFNCHLPNDDQAKILVRSIRPILSNLAGGANQSIH